MRATRLRPLKRKRNVRIYLLTTPVSTASDYPLTNRAAIRNYMRTYSGKIDELQFFVEQNWILFRQKYEEKKRKKKQMSNNIGLRLQSSEN